MTRKTAKKPIRNVVTVTLSEPYRIYTSLSEGRVLVPKNGIDSRYYDTLLQCRSDVDVSCVRNARFVTNKDAFVRVNFLMTISDGRQKELDSLCEDLYQMPFHRIKSMWIARLGSVSDMWNLLEISGI